MSDFSYKMTFIANAIRDITGSTAKLSLDDIALEVQNMSEGGCLPDKFWNIFQQNGLRTDYSRAFAYWRDSQLVPRHDICGNMDSAFYMFNYGNENWRSTILDAFIRRYGAQLIYDGGSVDSSLWVLG